MIGDTPETIKAEREAERKRDKERGYTYRGRSEVLADYCADVKSTKRGR